MHLSPMLYLLDVYHLPRMHGCGELERITAVVGCTMRFMEWGSAAQDDPGTRQQGDMQCLQIKRTRLMLPHPAAFDWPENKCKSFPEVHLGALELQQGQTARF